jgi:hypothetical protein
MFLNMKIRLRPVFLGFFMCLAASVPAFGYTVSFIVVETGLVQGGAPASSSNVWENGLMDVFFDAGHIVSNAQTIRISQDEIKDFPDEARADLNDAREGGVDFFVMALLDYQSPNTASAETTSSPRRVSLRVFRVEPLQKVYEQGYSGPVRDELAGAKNAARSILPHLRDR